MAKTQTQENENLSAHVSVKPARRPLYARSNITSRAERGTSAGQKTGQETTEKKLEASTSKRTHLD